MSTSAKPTSAVNDDVLSPAAIADPQSFFRDLRDIDPVYFSQRHGVYILTGHAEVHAAFRDKHMSSARAMQSFRGKLAEKYQRLLKNALQLLDGWMLLNDPPDHTRLRDPVRKTFTPAVANKLIPKIAARVDRLMDEFESDYLVDIVSKLSHPLTALVICDLLGVEEQDQNFLRSWTQDFGKLIYGASSNESDYAAAVGSAGDIFYERMRPLLEKRRADPQDDLISALLKASAEAQWTEAELLGACSMLLFAGHDTTAALIASSVRALCLFPQQREQFEYDETIHASAVEELLRYDGPSKTFVRVNNETMQIGDHEIEEGSTLWLAITGANHDPAVFNEPAVLNLERDPNPHVSFGGGIHFCVGASLARVEARVALQRLFARYPKLRLHDTQHQWHQAIVDRSLTTLPVALV
ncbi:MAG: cytochrome P450 [Pseudomonadota bacterium]